MKFFAICVFMIALSGCTNEADTRRTLYSAGYTDVAITGYNMFECGDDDTFHTGFRAKNPVGARVEGTVCCGMISKGCTIRF